MIPQKWLLASVLALAVSSSVSSAVTGRRVLVLLDTLAIRETHSMFFKGLQERGMEMTFKSADDASLQLIRYGELMHDHLILFSPSVEEFGGTLSAEAVIQFVDEGGNVLIAGSSGSSDLLREIATDMGVELDEEGASVIDHLHYDVADGGQHTLIVGDSSNLLPSSLAIMGTTKPDPFLYQGTGIVVDTANPLVLPLITASGTAYSHKPDKPITMYPHATGSSTVLVAGIQARNNARVLISGSLEFFSDEFFNAKVEESKQGGLRASRSGNQALSMALTAWVLKEQGVLRVIKVEHHRKGEAQAPAAYTVKEDVVYQITIEEKKGGMWVPFESNDVQLEFVRIDPFVRQRLSMVRKGVFEAQFKAPDVYGVYQFKVDYKKLGYTFLYSTTQISVHPLQHTQYERFIVSAFPYYVSAFSMMAGVWLLSCVFLHHKDTIKDKTE